MSTPVTVPTCPTSAPGLGDEARAQERGRRSRGQPAQTVFLADLATLTFDARGGRVVGSACTQAHTAGCLLSDWPLGAACAHAAGDAPARGGATVPVGAPALRVDARHTRSQIRPPRPADCPR